MYFNGVLVTYFIKHTVPLTNSELHSWHWHRHRVTHATTTLSVLIAENATSLLQIVCTFTVAKALFIE